MQDAGVAASCVCGGSGGAGEGYGGEDMKLPTTSDLTGFVILMAFYGVMLCYWIIFQ